MPVRVTPGPEGTPSDRRRAEEMQRLQAGELDAVRAQADKWRTGLTGLTGLITAIAAIKGPATVNSLGPVPGTVVAVLLLLAIVQSAAGSFFAMRAAYGFPGRRETEATFHALVAREQSRLRRSCRDLHVAVALAYFSLAMAVAAIAVTWFG